MTLRRLRHGAGRFIEPSRWRRGGRLQASKGPAAGVCQMKGNISRSCERFYHVPGGRDYGLTRIDESKGELRTQFGCVLHIKKGENRAVPSATVLLGEKNESGR